MSVSVTNEQCHGCGKSLSVAYYVSMDSAHPGAENFYHLQCILTSSSLVKRSAKASVIVGTVLLALNQGDFIIAGDFYTAMLWKIPLTYLVPFCVSSWGSITNAKRFSRS